MKLDVPELYADSSAGVTVAKKLGPGGKLKHLEVSHFYVQAAQRTGLLKVKKVKGLVNPANFLTKHPPSGHAVEEAMPSMGMLSLSEEYLKQQIANARHLKVAVLTSSRTRETPAKEQSSSQPWKAPVLTAGNTLQIAALASLMMLQLAP